MRHRWYLALTAFLLTACASEVPVQCGGCPGPHYDASGLPPLTGPAVVVECFEGGSCTRQHVAADPEPEHGITGNAAARRITPPDGSGEELDGSVLTVTIRSDGTTWEASGTLVDRPSQGGCDCSAGLHTSLEFSPRG
jgi:hypothetical protein